MSLEFINGLEEKRDKLAAVFNQLIARREQLKREIWDERQRRKRISSKARNIKQGNQIELQRLNNKIIRNNDLQIIATQYDTDAFFNTIPPVDYEVYIIFSFNLEYFCITINRGNMLINKVFETIIGRNIKREFSIFIYQL